MKPLHTFTITQVKNGYIIRETSTTLIAEHATHVAVNAMAVANIIERLSRK